MLEKFVGSQYITYHILAMTNRYNLSVRHLTYPNAITTNFVHSSVVTDPNNLIQEDDFSYVSATCPTLIILFYSVLL